VVKLQTKWKPPVATDRGSHAGANVPRVMPDGAVWKKRGVNSGGLSSQRMAKCPGMDAPGDQKDAKAEPSPPHRGEASKSETGCSHAQIGSPVGREESERP
jgi:hypothetical protein